MSDLNLRRRPAEKPGRLKYQAAASWAADVHGSLARVAARSPGSSPLPPALVAVLEALALAGLAPLKTVVPYTIEVDRQTGYVQMVKGLQPGPLSETSAVTQSFLVQYVIARETFDAADLRDNYRKVTLWSAGSARNSLRSIDMRKTNPASPLNLYHADNDRQHDDRQRFFAHPDDRPGALRDDPCEMTAAGAIAPQGAFVAVMSFRYTGAPMRMEDRFLNPL